MSPKPVMGTDNLPFLQTEFKQTDSVPPSSTPFSWSQPHLGLDKEKAVPDPCIDMELAKGGFASEVRNVA